MYGYRPLFDTRIVVWQSYITDLFDRISDAHNDTMRWMRRAHKAERELREARRIHEIDKELINKSATTISERNATITSLERVIDNLQKGLKPITVLVGVLPGKIEEVVLKPGSTVGAAVVGRDLATLTGVWRFLNPCECEDQFNFYVNSERATLNTKLGEGDCLLLVHKFLS